MELRKIMSIEMDRLMEQNPKIAVVSADLARAHENIPLQKKYPDRAFNVGVCEANMVGVAAGMAAYGMTAFVYSFASFASRRVCDQIALSVCHPKLSVKIVGSDPGISATILGATHSAFDDIGALRSIPGLVIYEVADGIQLKQAIPQIIDYDGAVYIRMLRRPVPDVFDENYRFDLFTADLLREGSDITILATGMLVDEAVQAEKLLAQHGISAEIINVHTIKPLDEQTILKSVAKTGAVLTCENHNLIGGLHSAVCELLCKSHPMKVHGIGANDRFSEVGDLGYLKELFGFTAQNIAEKAKQAVEGK